jgi:hypothetical protein
MQVPRILSFSNFIDKEILMMFFVYAVLTALVLAMFKHTRFSRAIFSGAITFFCYVSVAVFIVVTYFTAFRRTGKRS